MKMFFARLALRLTSQLIGGFVLTVIVVCIGPDFPEHASLTQPAEFFVNQQMLLAFGLGALIGGQHQWNFR